MYSPSIIESDGRDEVFVSAGTHLCGISGSNQRYSTTTFPTAPYAAIVPDAGSGNGPRYFLSWVNSDPNGQGAVEAWVALPYHVSADLVPLSDQGTMGSTPASSANAASIPANAGSNLSLTARTPSLSTASITAQWATVPNTSAAYTATDDIGSVISLATVNGDGTNATASEPYSLWQVDTALPTKIQQHPGTYYLDLTATANPGSSLSPVSTGTAVTVKNAIEVVVTAPTNLPPTCSSACNAPPPTGTVQGDLTFQAYGAANHTHPHPYPTAKLGDTVVVTLTVPESQIQLASNETFQSAYLTQATLTYPHGIVVQGGLVADPTYTEQIESLTKPMLISGMSATRQILENWAGFPPPMPPATNDGVYPLTAQWTVAVTYTVTTHSEACNAQGTNCIPTTQTHTATEPISGSAAVNMVITGSDWYIIPTVTQVGTQ